MAHSHPNRTEIHSLFDKAPSESLRLRRRPFSMDRSTVWRRCRGRCGRSSSDNSRCRVLRPSVSVGLVFQESGRFQNSSSVLVESWDESSPGGRGGGLSVCCPLADFLFLPGHERPDVFPEGVRVFDFLRRTRLRPPGTVDHAKSHYQDNLREKFGLMQRAP